jgi:putative transposase
MRYVELNPVRAHLVDAPWKWPWSSALAHIGDNATDPALDRDWAEYLSAWDSDEWKEMLSGESDPVEAEKVRRATRTGEPLGSRGFVAGLERLAGRRLRVLERGRPKAKKPRLPDAAATQGKRGKRGQTHLLRFRVAC